MRRKLRRSLGSYVHELYRLRGTTVSKLTISCFFNHALPIRAGLCKRINEKACQDHASFIRIIKSGATALNGARRDKAKAEADLKKSKATAAVAPDCAILMIKEAHANE
jgi:hypothetical protein